LVHRWAEHSAEHSAA
jgi:hypothetical protein